MSWYSIFPIHDATRGQTPWESTPVFYLLYGELWHHERFNVWALYESRTVDYRSPIYSNAFQAGAFIYSIWINYLNLIWKNKLLKACASKRCVGNTFQAISKGCCLKVFASYEHSSSKFGEAVWKCHVRNGLAIVKCARFNSRQRVWKVNVFKHRAILERIFIYHRCVWWQIHLSQVLASTERIFCYFRDVCAVFNL